MYFKQILNEDAGCSSYVIASRESKEAVVVDPSLDIEQYLELARRRDFRVVLVIDTHIHADHVSGARRLADAAGTEVAMHESSEVSFPIRRLCDGEVISVGELNLEVWHTPGHRPEAISILIANPPRAEMVSMVLTGDALFVGDVGRPDFGGADGADQQYESVQRLLGLNDFVGVFPAHFEGSCGKGMCGRPSSTIGFERRFNPIVQMSKAAFRDAMAETPPKPLNMTAILATNRGEADQGWAEPRIVDAIDELPPAEAEGWLARGNVTVIDVREPEEFAGGHLPDALSIPQGDLATRMQDFDRDATYLVTCAGGVRSARAVHYLTAAGFRHAVSLAGGINRWLQEGYAAEGAATASLAAADTDRYFHAAG